MTCAHNCYDRQNKKKNIDLAFTTGYNNVLTDTICVNKIFYPKKFESL